MKLTEYLSSASGKKKIWVRVKVLLADQNLEHIEANFETESRLSEDVWIEVFAVLDLNSPWSELEKACAMVFQRFTLTGPAITNTPQPKGRALEVGRFKAMLQQEGVVTSPDAATQFMDDVRQGHIPAIPYAQQLQTCRLGRYLLWSTFDESGGYDPFTGVADAETIRTRLGLPAPAQPSDRELVLLVYTVPPSVTVRYPTIADAYAGTP